MSYPVSFACPAMATHPIGGGDYMTDAEPMVMTLHLPTGDVQATVTIPPTRVRRTGFLRKQVDACEGKTDPTSPIKVSVKLPPEPVVLCTAKAIDAPTVVTLQDGTVLTGSVRFPDAMYNIATGKVAAVVATGTLQ